MRILSLKRLSKILNLPDHFSLKKDMLIIGGFPSVISLKENLDFLDAMFELAPEVRLHPEDETRPSSVEFYLSRVDLWYGKISNIPGRYIFNSIISSIVGALPQLIKQSPSMDQLVNQTYRTVHSGRGNKETKFFLKIQSDNEESAKKGEKEKFNNGQVSGEVPCYCHAKKVPNTSNTWDFQYMFFYPFNGMSFAWIGDHDGDWEHITVRVNLKNRSEVMGVYFSAHDEEGGWAHNQNQNGPTLLPRLSYFARNSSGQIIVYSAKDSHASIEGPGEVDRSWPKPNDVTSDNGPTWDCRGQLKFVGNRSAPAPGQEWIKFTGYWGGSVGSVGSPWFQKGGWWKDLERENSPN